MIQRLSDKGIYSAHIAAGQGMRTSPLASLPDNIDHVGRVHGIDLWRDTPSGVKVNSRTWMAMSFLT